jgi:hypothetical protein
MIVCKEKDSKYTPSLKKSKCLSANNMNTLVGYSGIPPRKNSSMGLMAQLFILAAALSSFGFDCIIAASYDRAFPDKWAHVPPKVSPHLVRNDTVYAGLPWGIHVFFKGYSRNASGKVDIFFSYKIVNPNGTVYYDTSGICAVSGFVGNDSGMLLSRYIPVVSFSPKDPIGEYKIIVTAEDRIAKAEKTITQAVILSNYPGIESNHFDDNSFNIWVHSYCIEPDPGRSIAAFYFFIESKLSNNDDIFWPVFYFFQCLFSDNPSLVKNLSINFPKCSARVQEYTVLLLRTIHIEKNAITSGIPDSLWQKFDKAAETGFYDPFTYAFKIKSDRFIEFGFYYYGQYSMIRFLIGCLGLNTPSGYEAFLKGCNNEYGEECLQCLDKETAQRFYSDARKILEKTYPKNLLVRAYCDYANGNGKVEANAKKSLAEIISSFTR